jgi:hypothetical protein
VRKRTDAASSTCRVSTPLDSIIRTCTRKSSLVSFSAARLLYSLSRLEKQRIGTNVSSLSLSNIFIVDPRARLYGKTLSALLTNLRHTTLDTCNQQFLASFGRCLVCMVHLIPQANRTCPARKRCLPLLLISHSLSHEAHTAQLWPCGCHHST